MYARGGADTGRGERAAYARVALSPCLLFVRERHTQKHRIEVVGLGPQHVNPAARRPAGERARNTCNLCGGRERPGAWQSRHSGNAA